MSLQLLGDCTFRLASTPLKSKNEWGVDTLRVQVKGARALAEAYIATLAQGQSAIAFGSGFESYYLQTWEPDDDPIVCVITLNYKGFASGGTPPPRIQTQIAPAAGTISAVYSEENGGRGRVYKRVPLYNLSYGRPEAGIVFDEVIADRDIYTTGAIMEFTYDAVQSVYRYITTGRPSGPRYFDVNIARIPVMKRARLTTADGSVYGKTHPAAFDDLEPEVLSKVISFTAEPIIGTPYFECEDVVRRELGEGDSDDAGGFPE